MKKHELMKTYEVTIKNVVRVIVEADSREAAEAAAPSEVAKGRWFGAIETRTSKVVKS